MLEIIGRASGRNVVVLDSVTGRVTLKLKDVPWERALDPVLASRNLGVEVSERVLLIADLPTLRRIQAERERQADWEAGGGRQPPVREIFSPQRVPAETLRAELARIKSGRGRVAVAGRDVQVEDDPEIVAVMTRIFQSLDREVQPEAD